MTETKSTSNIYLAAALLSRSYELVEIDREDPRHIKFTFSGDNLGQAFIDWMNKQFMGNLCEYSTCLQRVMQEIHTRG